MVTCLFGIASERRGVGGDSWMQCHLRRAFTRGDLLRRVASGLVGLCLIAAMAPQAPAQIQTQRDRDRDGGVLQPNDSGDAGRDRSARPGAAEDTPRLQIAPELRPRPDGEMSLGVEVRPAQVGYVINRVLPHTPAWRAGLEPGDRIVTVDGYQGGNVGHRFYDLQRELQLRAADDLAAVLLVQNVRNRQLVPVPVRFDHRGPLPPRGFEEDADGGAPAERAGEGQVL